MGIEEICVYKRDNLGFCINCNGKYKKDKENSKCEMYSPPNSDIKTYGKKQKPKKSFPGLIPLPESNQYPLQNKNGRMTEDTGLVDYDRI